MGFFNLRKPKPEEKISVKPEEGITQNPSEKTTIKTEEKICDFQSRLPNESMDDYMKRVNETLELLELKQESLSLQLELLELENDNKR